MHPSFDPNFMILKKLTQVVLELQTAQGGIPVGYELYPVNTYEGKTLIDSVKNH